MKTASPLMWGDALLGKLNKASGIDLRSPDWTCDGNLSKVLGHFGRETLLGENRQRPFQQQPFNEVIAYKMADRLGIPHIPYALLWDEGLPYSVCEDFVTPKHGTDPPPGG